MGDIEIRRLRAGDEELAQRVFRVMAEVFDEGFEELTLPYVGRLLERSNFWAMAALEGGRAVGGITAHQLPMTHSEASELFIYDLAVAVDYQRKGIGRALVRALVEAARAEGMRVAFVPAEEEDTHALEFYRAIGGKESAVRFFVFD